MARVVFVSLALGALLLGAFAFVRLPASAQEATPAACPATSEEENVALITRFYEAWVAGEDVTPFLAEDHVSHRRWGEDAVGVAPAFVDTYREDYPDLTAEPELFVAQDDLVAVYVTWAGTHLDDNEQLGHPATGRAAEWVSAVFYRVECGQITELWALDDHLGKYQDLRVITEEELQSAEVVATPTS